MKRYSDKIACPKWTRDLHETDLYQIDYVTGKVFEVLRNSGYWRIDTPTFEHAEVFKSSWHFDPNKCYTFQDKSGRDLVLRTDINAPMIRSILNNPTTYKLPLKLFSCDKVFRYRNGKKREFRMWGIEVFGVENYGAEIDILLSVWKIIKSLGFTDFRVKYNHIGLIATIIRVFLDKYGGDTRQINDMIYSLRYGDKEVVMEQLRTIGLGESEIQFVVGILEKDENNFEWLKWLKWLHADVDVIIWEIESFYEWTKKFWIESIFCPSELHGTWFYSGLTYKVYLEDIEDEMADWWRYDTMAQALWWTSIAATWLWFWIERLVRFMKLKWKSAPNETRKILIFTKDQDAQIALERNLQEFWDMQAGFTLELDFLNNKLSRSLEYAWNKWYSLLIYIENGNYRVIDVKDKTEKISQVVRLSISEIMSQII